MRPGLSRAIPMGIFGFLIGALLVVVVRFLQNLDPVWVVGSGSIIATLFSAGFFVWGMGAFDKRMSAHGEEHEEAPETEHVEEEVLSPVTLLSGSVWQITTITMIFLFVVAIAAFIPGGFTLQTAGDSAANTSAVGFFTAELFGRQVIISQLTVFMGFLAFMFLSLLAIGGAIGWVMNSMAQGLQEAKLSAAGAGAASGTPQLSAPLHTEVPARPAIINIPQPVALLGKLVITFLAVYALFFSVLLPMTISHAMEWQTPLALFFGVAAAIFVARPPFLPTWLHTAALIGFLFGILYFIFFEIAIGIVMKQPYEMRVMLSLVNALAIAVLLVRPSFVLMLVTKGAGIAARILRGVPGMLQ